jgi:hypothetical protein
MPVPATTSRQRARPKVYLWPDGKAAGRVDLSPFVNSFSYSKSIQEPVGNWSLSLLPSVGATLWGAAKGPSPLLRSTDLERMLRPNGVVSIGFEEPGGLCIGLIDRYSVSRSTGGTTAGTQISITGSDFGKVLARDHIVRASLTVPDELAFKTKILAAVGAENALINALPGTWGPLSADGVPTFLGQSVKDVIDWILKVGPSMTIPLLAATGGTGRLGDAIQTDGSVTSWNTDRIHSEAPNTFQGSIWDFIRSILDEDFYEVFVDSVPQTNFFKPPEIPEIRLTVRPKPFDEFAIRPMPVFESPGITWESLKTRIDNKQHHEIPAHELCGPVELENSDADVFSYYLVTADHELIGNPDGLKEGLFYPAVDLFALQRAGLRAYEGRLSLVSPDVSGKQRAEVDYDLEVGAQVVEFRNRLFNWYRLSEYFETGSITVAGRDRYRIGDPVFLPWRTPNRGFSPGTRYYCVSTTHSWSVGRPYTTTLRLTRGHNSSSIANALSEIATAGAAIANPTMLASTS